MFALMKMGDSNASRSSSAKTKRGDPQRDIASPPSQQNKGPGKLSRATL